jgi:Ca2+-binding RTX toxin-like protein
MFGTNENDQIDGTIGADTLQGLGGNDTLWADAGNDLLEGGDGNDNLFGKSGNDTLLGGSGDDFLRPGSGSDSNDGGSGTDVLMYSLTTETFGIILNATSTTKDGVGANQVLKVNTNTTDIFANIEAFHGSYGNDIIHLEYGNWVFLRAGADNITIYGYGTHIIPGSGNDTIVGDDKTPSSLSYWNDGFDDLDNTPQSSGITVVFSEAMAGTVTNDGWGGIDVFSGVNEIDGSQLDDHITGGSGSDDLAGDDGDDTIFGGSGNDELRPGAGSDEVDGGEGDDELEYHRHDDDVTQGIFVTFTDQYEGTVIDYAGDIDVFYNIEEVRGTNNDDTIIGIHGEQDLRGDDGDDLISGGDDDDKLEGNAGSDTLNGDSGDDYLQPGSGTDSIDGGSGDGDKIVYKHDDDAATGVVITWTSETSGTALDWAGDTDTFTGIERAKGTDFDDTLTGMDGNQTLEGEAGNDSLFGGAGDDGLFGGAGDDTLDGGDGEWDFSWYGNSGGGIVLDMVTGIVTSSDMGTDSISNIEAITATNFADSLTGDDANNWFRPDADGGNPGENGADTVDGGGGEDWISYTNSHSAITVDMQAGTIIDADGNTDVIMSIEVIAATAHNDTMAGSDGEDQARFYVDYADVSIDGTAESFTVTSADGVDVLTGFEILRFNDQEVAVSDIFSTGGIRLNGDDSDEVLDGTDGDDVIDGGGGLDTINGDAGNDTLTGGSNVDRIDGGAGADSIVGYGGDDQLYGGADDDYINGKNGDDYIYGRTENDLLIGSGGRDRLRGNSGDDTMEGGQKNDFLQGGAGADVFVFNTNDGSWGKDFIKDFELGVDQVVVEGFTSDDVVWKEKANASGVIAKFAGGGKIAFHNLIEEDLNDFSDWLFV